VCLVKVDPDQDDLTASKNHESIVRRSCLRANRPTRIARGRRRGHSPSSSAGPHRSITRTSSPWDLRCDFRGNIDLAVRRKSSSKVHGLHVVLLVIYLPPIRPCELYPRAYDWRLGGADPRAVRLDVARWRIGHQSGYTSPLLRRSGRSRWASIRSRRVVCSEGDGSQAHQAAAGVAHVLDIFLVTPRRAHRAQLAVGVDQHGDGAAEARRDSGNVSEQAPALDGMVHVVEVGIGTWRAIPNAGSEGGPNAPVKPWARPRVHHPARSHRDEGHRTRSGKYARRPRHPRRGNSG